MWRTGIFVCVVACAWNAPHGLAQAQRVTETASAPRLRGTHHMAELEGGITPAATPGFAGSLLFGSGGRPPGTPLRIYAIAEVSFADSQPAIALRVPSVRADERSYFGLAAGVRLYVPIAGELRLFLDALGGASYNTAKLETAAVQLDESDWFIQGALAGGLQYRLLNGLSLGARVKWTASDDPLSDVRDRLGLSDAFPFTITTGMTWHF
jgi:hypothetical protein